MISRRLSLVSLCLLFCAGSLSAAEPMYKLEEVKGAPAGLSEKIAARLNPTAYKVTGPNGVVCEIWLAKDLPVKEDFKPTLMVKYPFTPGELIGAIRLPTKGAALDFRGQELPVGTYTLRYGQQPQDGNHLGTSDTSDFILACSAEVDKDPARVATTGDLFKMSAKAAGTSHPAIFLLLPPPAKEFKETKLSHNQDKNLWILDVNAPGKLSGKAVAVPLQLVVAGTAEG